MLLFLFMFLLSSRGGGHFVNGDITSDGLFKLDILHYNDFHDRFEETSRQYSVCNTNDENCVGGFARLYYEIMFLFKEKPNALLLNAGDTFQGTYWYSLLKWNVTQKFINLLPNDAQTIGNHEFDDGVEGLAPYLAALEAPVVVANIDTTQEPLLEGLYKPHVVLQRQGRRIGIIGLTTTETKQSSADLKVNFMDPFSTAKREAQQLTEKGIDIIVVLSHCGYDVDKELAEKVGENIDIIVGGHTHSLLWNRDPPKGDKIEGSYPTVVESAHRPEHKVLVVTASAFTKFVGNLSAYFNDDGELMYFDGEPVYLNRSIPEDPKIKRLLQPYETALHRFVGEVVGYTNDDLDSEPCGQKECTIGNIIADSFLTAAERLNTPKLPHVSFLLRTMIRGSIPKGEITRGKIINALPYKRKVVTFTLRGKYLVQALERCMSNYWALNPFNGPWMPHVSGLQVVLDGKNRTVVSVSVKDGEHFKPIDEEQEYRVTTLDALRKGDLGFTMLSKNALNVNSVGVDSIALLNYVKEMSPISLFLDKRLTVLN